MCRQFDIPLAVERSRSGNGAHDWLFFEESVTAAIARKLGSAILTTEKNQISIQRCKEFFISIPVSLSNENIIISDSEKTYYEGLCEG
ncbi:TOTE conflict system archaeo-eukaryotic primase domain-containing protein [Ruminococcus bovis]|uniref:TOTE conflict system archaeo-eukaryotic primase domain-containing protein n=1 Tax=Ruminococcus bovis TaxID=2564099 RepID=UPI0038CD865F